MSGYIGSIPTPQATQTRDTFTATAGQVTFATNGYTPSFLDVYRNGVHLVDGIDYTASNGSDVVLTSGAAAGDTLVVVAYRTFELANLSNLSNRNLIVGGSMRVAQRGTSHSQPSNVGDYHTVDRFSYRRTGAWSGVTSVSLTQESSGGPAGFKNYLRYAPVGADSTTPSDTTMQAQHVLEGLNASQLDWGTSNAKNVTLSFYVRSTVTGTFGVFIDDANPASTKTMQIKEYAINSVNTWERKSLTFLGPTSGNWPLDNGKCLSINWIISGDSAPPGSGSNTVVSPNSWVVPTTESCVTSNQSDALTTSSGNTFDITGTQLEVNNTATEFDHISYGQELSLCQRYYYQPDGRFYTGISNHTGVFRNYVTFPCNMRATPTVIPANVSSGTLITIYTSPSLHNYEISGGRPAIGDTSPFKFDAEL